MFPLCIQVLDHGEFDPECFLNFGNVFIFVVSCDDKNVTSCKVKIGLKELGELNNFMDVPEISGVLYLIEDNGEYMTVIEQSGLEESYSLPHRPYQHSNTVIVEIALASVHGSTLEISSFDERGQHLENLVLELYVGQDHQDEA